MDVSACLNPIPEGANELPQTSSRASTACAGIGECEGYDSDARTLSAQDLRQIEADLPNTPMLDLGEPYEDDDSPEEIPPTPILCSDAQYLIHSRIDLLTEMHDTVEWEESESGYAEQKILRAYEGIINRMDEEYGIAPGSTDAGTQRRNKSIFDPMTGKSAWRWAAYTKDPADRVQQRQEVDDRHHVRQCCKEEERQQVTNIHNIGPLSCKALDVEIGMPSRVMRQVWKLNVKMKEYDLRREQAREQLEPSDENQTGRPRRDNTNASFSFADSATRADKDTVVTGVAVDADADSEDEDDEEADNGNGNDSQHWLRNTRTASQNLFSALSTHDNDPGLLNFTVDPDTEAPTRPSTPNAIPSSTLSASVRFIPTLNPLRIGSVIRTDPTPGPSGSGSGSASISWSVYDPNPDLDPDSRSRD